MKREHPQLNISIEEKGSMEIIEDIRNNKTHLGFIAIYAKQLREFDGLHFSPMYSGKLVVGTHHLSELAKHSRVTPDQLKEHKLALYRDGFIEDFIKEFTYDHGPLSILFKTNNSEAINMVLRNDIAATIDHVFLSPKSLMERRSGEDGRDRWNRSTENADWLRADGVQGVRRSRRTIRPTLQTGDRAGSFKSLNLKKCSTL